jgi:hypothetical protein
MDRSRPYVCVCVRTLIINGDTPLVIVQKQVVNDGRAMFDWSLGVNKFVTRLSRKRVNRSDALQLGGKPDSWCSQIQNLAICFGQCTLPP